MNFIFLFFYFLILFKGLVCIENQKSETIADAFRAMQEKFGIEKQTKLLITSDGANNMGLFIRKVNGIQQKCMAHGINLVFSDLIYSKNSKIFRQATDAAIANGQTDDNSNQLFSFSDLDEVVLLQTNYIEAVSKVRAIVTKLRSSNVLMAALRKYSDLMPIYDVKTRWSSLANMLERFVEIWSSIQKAGLDNADIKAIISDFKGDDEALIRKITSTLLPLRTATEKLSQSDIDLTDAEDILHFCYTSLEDPTVKEVFKMKMAPRRSIVSDVLCFLTSKTHSVFYVEPTDDQIKELYSDLFGKDTNGNSNLFNFLNNLYYIYF